ncbi:MAG: polysaccharide biosynthesis tyrosine autokinase [Gemmatimonadota bacterium]|nr:polysaccharide biosynthesis tyrosine autokinase [Gemmatimonadota bacterium]
MNELPITQTQPRRFAHREIHVKDLLAVVFRHWFIVLVSALLVSAGAYITGRRATPRFQSSLTVQINSQKQVFARLDDIDVDEMALRTDPILSEALVLTTHRLGLEVAKNTGLQLQLEDLGIFRGNIITDVAVDPEAAQEGFFRLIVDQAGFRLENGLGTLLDEGQIGETVQGLGFSFLIVPPSEPVDVGFRIVSPDVAASMVTGGLGYSVRSGTNAVDISYTGTDPTVVASVLNAAANQLRETGVSRLRESAGARRLYIEQQLLRSDSAVRQSQLDLQLYKEGQEIADLSSEQVAIAQTIRQLDRDRQLALVQIATVSEAMNATDSIGVETLNRLAAIEGVASNPALQFQIQSLLELYDERRSMTAGAMGLRETNPQVSRIDEQIRNGHRALRSAVDANVRSLAARVDALDGEMRDQRQLLRGIPGMETRIGQLNLETTILSETHRYLLGQYEAARLQEATITPYVNVLDRATPAYGIGTTLQQRLMLGLMVGLLLGIAGAFFLEYLDQTIKSSADIERVLGVPVLGMVPNDGRVAKRRSAVVTMDEIADDEPTVEAYRALRTNVTFVGAEKPLQFVSVTSPGPREGKSTTAVNLAVALAQAGRSTLLIDGDLRRSTVHEAFDLERGPGLTDLLIAKVTKLDAIHRNVLDNLDVLSAGSTPPNPSELLGSSSMHALIANLRRDYEYIIIDTPPTLPVTDAAVVASSADATILVVRSGETEETAAERALEQLRRVRARIAGAVLNGISNRKDPQYSYYSYRRETPSRRGKNQPLKSRIAALL